MSYTKAPWFALSEDGQHGIYTKPSENPETNEPNNDLGYEICYCTPQDNKEEKQWQANMLLIAAAPELFEALENLLEQIDSCDGTAQINSDMALAAIKKAQGKF